MGWDNFEQLIECNNLWLDKFNQSALIQLINTKGADSKIKNAMLDAVQTLSNYFQRAMLLRSAITDDPIFSQVFDRHLAEEFNHHHLLKEERGHRQVQWDATLEATCAWFCWKLLTADNIEKTLLIHFVLEASAHCFFELVAKYSTSQYFVIHQQHDAEHEAMGMQLLQELRPAEYKNLSRTQTQGWEMLLTATNRIAHLAML